uniref:Leukocyte immunoglobulin-like receptor subfamily A member 6 n=1 Tax=Monodelphis domestica TaxID=13616 RepID=A0A5F8GMG9_MONDO
MTPAFSVLLCLGTYWCFYSHSSYGWSKCSDPLKLVVTGLSAPPSLAVLPSSEVASGQSMTLQCRSELYYDWFTLCKDGKEISRRRTQSHGRGRQADFLAVNLTHDGTYQCYGFHSSSPYQWSSPSAPLVFLVSGTFSTSPESENKPSGLSRLQAGILVDVSACPILTSYRKPLLIPSLSPSPAVRDSLLREMIYLCL